MTQGYDSTPAASGEDRLEAALELARKGLPVLPLCWPTWEGTCGCGRGHENNAVGKAPLTPRGVLDATADEETVRLWWSIWPQANVGLALAPAELLSIAPDSAAWQAEFERRGLPEGAAAFDSGGGEGHVHYLFHRPAACPTRRLCRAGEFDILADGYVVVPPSRHRSGRPYRWLRPLVEVGFLPDAPAWAVEMLQAASRPAAVDGEEDDDGPPVRLSEEAMKWWRGEKRCQRPDGHVDRSATLFAIGLVLADAGAAARTIARCLADRDVALGFHKYSDRQDGGWEEYLRIARKALLFSKASSIAGAGNSATGAGNSATGAGNSATGAGNSATGAGNSATGAGNSAGNDRKFRAAEFGAGRKFEDCDATYICTDESERISGHGITQPPGGDDESPPGGGFKSPAPLVRFVDSPPVQWLIEGLLASGFTTNLYGDSASGKSWLSLYLALLIAGGQRDFVGVPLCGRGAVLYLDWELSPQVHGQRLARLLAGAGLKEPPAQLFYRRMDAPLLEAWQDINAWVQELRPVLVVIDSYQAAVLDDPLRPQVVAAVYQALRELEAAVLVVDHQAAAGELTYAARREFGSSYKRHLARSSLQVERRGGDERTLRLLLRQQKNTFGPRCADINLVIRFEGEDGPVSVRRAGEEEEGVLAALARLGEATAREIAGEAGLEVQAAGSVLAALRRRGQVVAVGKAGRSKLYALPGRRTEGSGDGDAQPAQHEANGAGALCCHECGRELARQQRRGRPARWCSEACRRRARRKGAG